MNYPKYQARRFTIRRRFFMRQKSLLGFRRLNAIVMFVVNPLGEL